MRKITILLSFLFYYSLSNAQSIIVTAPNGGEVLYACQTYIITWTAAGTSNFYDIEYSLNNVSTCIYASPGTSLKVSNGKLLYLKGQ